jgi:hypothetical protein
MNYMLLIYHPGEPPKAPEEDGIPGCAREIAERIKATGKYIGAGVLQPASTATSLRRREGERVITDGPFAETREQLAGYLIVEADSLEEAMHIAEEHPVAETGTIEIRPVAPIK